MNNCSNCGKALKSYCPNCFDSQREQTKKYAVMVKAISEHPWTETVEDSQEAAEEKERFIKAHLRGVTVEIVPFEDK